MMKKLGYLMITVGFLAGSLAAVVDEEHIHWGYFAIGLIVGVAGVALVRRSGLRESRSEGKLASNMQSVEASLARIGASFRSQIL